MRSPRRKIPGIESRDWHAMAAADVAAALGSGAEGLSVAEATKRRAAYGQNAFSPRRGRGFVGRLFEEVRSPLIVILIIAAALTFALNDTVDGIVILIALCIAVSVGIVQEGRASRAFEHLARSQSHTATIIRDGARRELPAAEVVPGDVVILQGGMQVPADIRLLEAKNLLVHEAPLTGEWMPVEKGTEPVEVGAALAERSPMAWKGTFVADGHGRGVVVATGDATEVGKLAGELADIEDEPTPLQWEMRRISRVIFLIILALVLCIFALGIARGESFETMLVIAIAIAVASVPEGLPAAVTIVLAVGMEALLARGGLVRNLLAAETLGATTFILTDKTGTLTEGRMTLTEIVSADQAAADGRAEGLGLSDDGPRRTTLQSAVYAADAFVERQETSEEGGYAVRGEPMERAILEAALDAGLATGGEDAAGEHVGRIDYLSFTSENRFAAGLVGMKSGARLCVSGAPEYILEASTSVLAPGKTPLDAHRRAFFAERIARYTKEGKRLIGVGMRDTQADSLPTDAAEILRDLTFAGLLVFDDPIREDVAEAIDEAVKAGASVRLVTGDNPQTALSVARVVGIAREHDVALVGKDVAELSDDELFEVLKTTRVFARILPRQKQRLAQVLQKHGEIVAMTGDGINDAAALQRANIGIALGSGTEVAKEASDLVLVNDTFATIVAAIEEGRRITNNLQKIVGYLISTSLSEALLIGAALVFGSAIPIVPVQILWANIIEEGLMSVAFAFEPADRAAMRERPRDIHEDGILSREMLQFIALTVGVLCTLLLALYAALLASDLPLETLRSVMFLVVALDSLFIAFSFRKLRVPMWKIPLAANRFFIGSFAVSFALFAVVLVVPFMQTLLSYTPLPLPYLALAVGYGLVSLLVIEVGKWLFFERRASVVR